MLLMGDFAQIPPALSTSLMAGVPIVESSGDRARCLALAGRQTFKSSSALFDLGASIGSRELVSSKKPPCGSETQPSA